MRTVTAVLVFNEAGRNVDVGVDGQESWREIHRTKVINKRGTMWWGRRRPKNGNLKRTRSTSQTDADVRPLMICSSPAIGARRGNESRERLLLRDG